VQSHFCGIFEHVFAYGESSNDLGLLEDAELGPAAIVATIASMEPGPGLYGLLSMLEPTYLGEAELIEVGAAWERQRRHDAAWELSLLAHLDSLPVTVPDDLEPDDDYRSAFMGPLEWVAVARSERADAYAVATAQPQVTIARKTAAALLLAASGPLAATGAALRSGRVSDSRARLIAEKLGDLPAADATTIEADVLPTADLISRGRLGRDLETRILACRALSAQETLAAARTCRRVTRPRPMPHGMAMLEVHGPAEDLQLLHTALTGIAEVGKAAATAAARAGGEPVALSRVEGIDAHRFDALINLAPGALHDDLLPQRHDRRPAIAITVALSTLLGLDDHPAQLAGHGPICAGAARRAAADPTGTWQRIITRPDGLVIDAAYTSYRPPQPLCDTIIARDGTCTFPGCDRPAATADLDHQTPWPAGNTSYSNLAARCRRHHNAKTAKLNRPRYDPDTGDTTWTDRRGRTTRRPGIRYPPPPPRQSVSEQGHQAQPDPPPF
jgi:hypothetical protein